MTKLDQETPLSHRLRRSRSWLERAASEKNADAKYIFLWISFNAAYAVDLNSKNRRSGKDPRYRKEYFEKLKQARFRINPAIHETLSKRIFSLMTNVYVFRPFWGAVSRSDPFNWKNWEEGKGKEGKEGKDFRDELNEVQRCLPLTRNTTATDMNKVLKMTFDRLYVLRNQLMHGCSTQHDSAPEDRPLNRPQIKDGAKILEALMPLFLNTMENHPEIDWGEISYPVRDDIRED